MRRWAFVFVFVILIMGCAKERAPAPTASSTTAAPAATTEWRMFHEVEYEVPVGTHAIAQESVMPGPGGSGGIPTGVRPKVSLSKPPPQKLYVTIERTRDPRTADAEKYVLVANKIGSDFETKPTSNGWEMTYFQTEGHEKVHIIYAAIAGGYFTCTFGEADSDVAAMLTLCRSLRAHADR